MSRSKKVRVFMKVLYEITFLTLISIGFIFNVLGFGLNLEAMATWAFNFLGSMLLYLISRGNRRIGYIAVLYSLLFLYLNFGSSGGIAVNMPSTFVVMVFVYGPLPIMLICFFVRNKQAPE